MKQKISYAQEVFETVVETKPHVDVPSSIEELLEETKQAIKNIFAEAA